MSKITITVDVQAFHLRRVHAYASRRYATSWERYRAAQQHGNTNLAAAFYRGATRWFGAILDAERKLSAIRVTVR